MSANCKCPLNRSVAFAVAAIVASAVSSTSSAAIYTWDGGISSPATSPTWGTAANWNPDVAPTFGTTADLSFPTSSVFNVNTFLGGARTVRSLSFGADLDSAFSVTFRDNAASTSRNLTLDTDAVGGNATVNVAAGATGAITIGATAAESTTTGNLVLADNLVVDHNGTGVLLFSRNISGTGFSVTKTGSGTMQTSTNNTFTGAMNVNGGRWIVSASSTSADLNNASSVNLGGGALEVRTSGSVAKTFDVVPVVVSAASTLSYNNTSTTTTQNLELTTAAMTLNADLRVENISASATLVNGINLKRVITGTGSITVATGNNITSVADASNPQRVQFTGNNPTWSGGLRIAAGTATINATAGGNPAGTGAIYIGASGDSFGAALVFNQGTGVDVTLNNAITVRSGGFRLIRNNGDFATNITLSGPMTLEGDLTVDHAVNPDRVITLSGNIGGAGALTISRNGGTTGRVRLSGTNNYTGNTTVSTGGTLILDGSLTSPLISVASGARFGGDGSSTGNLTLASGASFVFSPTATIDVDGAVTLDSSFGVSSLINANGSTIDWSLVPDGTYTLIGSTPSTFSHISNFGLANAATVASGTKFAYFQQGSLQLVLTPVPEPTTLSVFVALGSLVTLRRRRD